MPTVEQLTGEREAYVKLVDVSPMFDTMQPLDKLRICGENVMIVQTFDYGFMYIKEYYTTVYFVTNRQMLGQIDTWKKSNPNKSVIKEGWYRAIYKPK